MKHFGWRDLELLLFGGPYVVELYPGVSLADVCVHPTLRVEGDKIKVEYGGIVVHPHHVSFAIGEDVYPIFRFEKRDIVCIRSGESGTVLWENPRVPVLMG